MIGTSCATLSSVLPGLSRGDGRRSRHNVGVGLAAECLEYGGKAEPGRADPPDSERRPRERAGAGGGGAAGEPFSRLGQIDQRGAAGGLDEAGDRHSAVFGTQDPVHAQVRKSYPC